MNERELEQRVGVLSNGAKQAIVMCAESFRFGGNWGFLRNSNHEFKAIIEALREDKDSVKPYPVSNGVIVVCDKNFLANSVNSVVPGGIGRDFVENARKRSETERQKFIKFLRDLANGKNRFVKQGNGYGELVLGIYSTNDTNLIRLNNIDYPAYKLNLQETLEFLRSLGNDSKKVYIKAIDVDTGKTVWGTVEQLAYTSKGMASIYKALEIAESNTGVFLTLRVKG